MILRPWRRRPAEARSGIPWLPYARMRSGGQAVSADTAMQHDAVWACVHLLAGTLATLPRDVVRGSGKGRTAVASLPSLIAEPSAEVEWIDWAYQVMVSWLLRGNVYGQIAATDALMRPTQIETIHPDAVKWMIVKGREVPMIDGKPRDIWPLGDLWHVPAFVVPGSRIGLSPIEYHRRTIATGLAVEQFAQDFFTDGAHPTALLSAEGDATIDNDQAQQVKDRFISAANGNREPIVLPSWLKYTQIQVSPNESQFLETQQYGDAKIARIFSLRPEMIDATGHQGKSSITYQNRQERMQDFLAFSLLFWLKKFETALSVMLPQPQELKLNPAGLLRADLKGRYDSYKIASEVGLLTIDEMRELEDRPPLPASDVPAPLPSPDPKGGTNG